MGAESIDIQAVCSFISARGVWLAVSRCDKSLSLYLLRSPDSTAAGDGASATNDASPPMPHKWIPSVVMDVPRRAGCLSFATVGGTLVVVAGDLSGDAIAFPVPITSDYSALSREHNADDDTDADGSNGGGDASSSDANQLSTRRLLLGHTASQITGLRIVQRRECNDGDDAQRFILTADRDEKVRISQFPDTHKTHGYLLGNSSFVSCMDAAYATHGDNGGGRSLCLTGGGDGTVRLWDAERCAEVGMVPVTIRAAGSGSEDVQMEGSEDGSEEKNDAKEEHEGTDDKEVDDSKDDKDKDDDTDDRGGGEPTIAIPHAVALSPDGSRAVVARDGVPSIDVHPVPPPAAGGASTTSLHEKETLECPSQPLAVVFFGGGDGSGGSSSILALVKDPEYLVRFSRQDGGYVAVPSCGIVNALRKYATSENIVLPQTVLEFGSLGKKDVHNHPLPEGQLPWNDVGRKDTAKKASARRRKRKWEEAKEARSDAGGEDVKAGGDDDAKGGVEDDAKNKGGDEAKGEGGNDAKSGDGDASGGMDEKS